MSATAETIRVVEKQGRDVRAELAEVQRQNPKQLSQATIAREAGISTTAISQWIGGTYGGDNDAVEAKVARWLDSYYQRRTQASMLPSAPEWIETPTAKRIISALSYAQLAGDIVVIYGAAGLGKTKANEHYERSNPNVWIATMSPASATAVPALEEVSEALGFREITGGAAKIQRAIIRRIRGTNGLLIIDEAQHLNVQALDAMRALHDATGIGLALVGNEAVYARMTGGNRAAYLDRLYSRIGKRVRLTRATQDDVDTLIAAWGFKEKQCIDICREIAAKPGGLRVLTKTLRLATLFAAGANRALCCDDIRAAWRDLGAES